MSWNVGTSRYLRTTLLLGASLLVLASGDPTGEMRAQADQPGPAAPATVQVAAVTQPQPSATAKPAPEALRPWSLTDPVLLTDEVQAQDHQMPPADARRYRRVFELQAEADWDRADREIARIQDQRLMGHVLHQRLMHPSYRAGFPELRAWLDRYADHPNADQVYRLAVRRQPRGERPPKAPAETGGLGGGNLESYDNQRPLDVKPRTRAERSAAGTALLEQVDRLLKAGELEEAVALLDGDGAAQELDPKTLDMARADVAAELFYAGHPREALRVAAEVAGRTGASIPLANWIAGLSAWRTGQIDRSARFFEAVVRGSGVSAWDVSAGAFWAARAHTRAGRPHEVSKWLARAAEYPRTFYGLIASRLLGIDAEFKWEVPELTAAHLAKLDAMPAGRRAIGLLQAGQRELAEAELRRINPQGEPLLEQSLLAISVRAQMPMLALRLGNAITTPEGSTWDAALYPVPPWTPPEGFAIDKALVFALMRQESRFDPRARSHAGASGLMQLMPATAGALQGQSPAQRANAPGEHLFEPGLNVSLGQRYLAQLAAHPEIGNNLLAMLAAYNAGPGNLSRWRKTMRAESDPLLFIETLPARETRTFVERVLANFWIYRLRLGQETPTLDALAAGQWPQFMPAEAPEMASYGGGPSPGGPNSNGMSEDGTN